MHVGYCVGYRFHKKTKTLYLSLPCIIIIIITINFILIINSNYVVDSIHCHIYSCSLIIILLISQLISILFLSKALVKK